MYYILCSMYYVLCFMYYVICSIFLILSSMFYVLCSKYYVLCFMYYLLCSMYYVLCSMYYVLCSKLYVLSSMYYVLCTFKDRHVGCDELDGEVDAAPRHLLHPDVHQRLTVLAVHVKVRRLRHIAVLAVAGARAVSLFAATAIDIIIAGSANVLQNVGVVQFVSDYGIVLEEIPRINVVVVVVGDVVR